MAQQNSYPAPTVNNKPTVVSITGIRPDFIRMSFVFKELDRAFNHILIHTGQHYDTNLSQTFFKELDIRDPDYILDTGKSCSNHYEQLAYLSTNIPKLFETHNINPDLILFLGDSNSAGVSFPLKKQGYRIGHIEAGMRSYDKRMLEEINRTVCDHCSDILFVYHEDYKAQLALENIHNHCYVVGNTVVEPLMLIKPLICQQPKLKNLILMDIHRPENFNYPERLKAVINFGNICAAKYGLPVKLLYFKRLIDKITELALDLGSIEIIPLMPYKTYLSTVYNSKFIISDSGTGQEEPALLGTPVIVPRDFTERPQSYSANCSIQLKLDNPNLLATSSTNTVPREFEFGANNPVQTPETVFKWLDDLEAGVITPDISWMMPATGIPTSIQIVEYLKYYLQNTTGSNPIETITDKIASYPSQLYMNTKPFPYMMLDNFLDTQVANTVQAEIMDLDASMWDRYENPFEQKYTLRDKFNLPAQVNKLFAELTAPEFVDALSAMVGYKLKLDTTRNFWGIHKYEPGDKLDIHVDAGYHPTLKEHKKQITLGIYLSYNWTANNNYGCELEIWDGENCSSDSAKIYKKVASIEPLFNRLIIFTCNDYAWHGNPAPATCPANSKRIFLTVSYLSDNQSDLNKRVKAFFVPRPGDPADENKERLRFLRADPDKYKEIYRV